MLNPYAHLENAKNIAPNSPTSMNGENSIRIHALLEIKEPRTGSFYFFFCIGGWHGYGDGHPCEAPGQLDNNIIRAKGQIYL